MAGIYENTCPVCEGYGHITAPEAEVTCPECKGTGKAN